MTLLVKKRKGQTEEKLEIQKWLSHLQKGRMCSVNVGRWNRGRIGVGVGFAHPEYLERALVVASFWITVQNFYPGKMMASVKFCSAFPDDEVCGGLGIFIFFFWFVSNWVALFLFYTFGYTLEICIWFLCLFLGWEVLITSYTGFLTSLSKEENFWIFLFLIFCFSSVIPFEQLYLALPTRERGSQLKGFKVH